MDSALSNIVEVKRLVREYLSDSECFIIQLVADIDEETSLVLKAKQEDLPKLLNVYSSPAKELLKHKLSKNDQPLNMVPFMDEISNTALSHNAMEELSFNDGEMSAISRVADALGMEQECQRAYELIYSI